MKKVVINEKVYQLNSEVVGKPGFSGTVYHLNEDVDLAVKIYHQNDSGLFPEKEDIGYFADCADQTLPVLLSQYAVFDLSGNYIGCAAPFLYEVSDTKKAIFQLSREKFLEYFHDIFATIPIFDQLGIELNDWSIQNIILGQGQHLRKRLYVIDDSNYGFLARKRKNSTIHNELVEDIIDFYLEDYPDIKRSFIDEMSVKTDYFDFLKQNSSGYPTVGAYLDDYITTYQKKKIL